MIIINKGNIWDNIVEDIKEKTEELENSNNELRALNCTIVHEIKAPVRAIDGYARIFIEDYAQQVNVDGINLINNIRNICSDTLLLINKLLDYIKFAEVESTKELINLELLIKSTFDELLFGYTDEKKIHLQFEGKLPSILGDNILMKQVIINIISNSLKFTHNKEVAVITVGYTFENNENIFYIKDNGVGFDMKFSERLFGIFERMHSDSEFEGSGVGLAIVKKLINKLGGRVWIIGEVGKGACTYFTIREDNILK
ncbi:sensor histidine kinase [Clostridium cellulovorans]|uniref:histidine kinase n=1 Tax=Clostridium cellulovorans (strain ATCC 35296 / DSM 3052 / OCM 3 / 743B) TaxID=573061 RepID=D9SVV3_CLOC7|nr:ATP-binding protein [Clostridium cellulovorans]ADL53164.1 histidine kinase [Clostridium cellulovorans 743B]